MREQAWNKGVPFLTDSGMFANALVISVYFFSIIYLKVNLSSFLIGGSPTKFNLDLLRRSPPRQRSSKVHEALFPAVQARERAELHSKAVVGVHGRFIAASCRRR